MSYDMRRVLFFIFAIAALALTSCNNKVDLYSNDGDTTIVYAMLDSNADTNFIKITHSFVGNVYDLGHNYAASNYEYDEIEATLTGVFEGSNATQTVTLDTISKWKPYDENSTFYSGCWQRYYYTTKTLLEGKEYELNILRKTDNVTISSKTTTINTFAFQKPVLMPITFTDVTTSTANVEWKVGEAPYKSTAAYFEVVGYFKYKELLPGAADTVHRSIRWELGSGKADDLYNTSSNLPYYLITYTPSALFTLLENNEYLKNNSPAGVQRWFEKFEFQISAIGEDLYNYYLVANSTSAIQDVPNFSNIDNGMGIMSARITKTRALELSVKTKNDIHNRFENYGFPYTYQ